MKLLVTGGAGYVGATVARMARDAGHQVVIVDDLSRNDERQIPSGVMFVRLRVQDVAEVLTPAAGFDAVLHFAGLIAAGESMAHPGHRLLHTRRRPRRDLPALLQRRGCTRLWRRHHDR